MAIAIIRVRGVRNVRKSIAFALKQLRLTRKNHCLVAESSGSWLTDALKKTKDYVTWGEVGEETLKQLEKRKPEFSIEKNGVKTSLYRLNNPRGGWKGVKTRFPKGDLGYRGEKISGLIEKMLH